MPNFYLQEIKEVGNELNIVPTIIRGEELKERGFGGIYGVGNAAVVPPALVILSHLVPNSKDTIAWVGKGIVYDTGGLCIKGRVGTNFTYRCICDALFFHLFGKVVKLQNVLD